MKKILTICIPTYKRPITLRRCIDSIVTQIDNNNLSKYVDIYVVDDASPDDTENVLSAYHSLPYFNGITRDKNHGMNVNIKCMLNEAKHKSDYHLIITDDDYLQPNVLLEIVNYLLDMKDKHPDASAIWTPRYSYTEDGALHVLICSPFDSDMYIKPSVYNAGKYMSNGFILSGLILRAKNIDYEFWDEYKENAYFPMIFFGDIILKRGGYYWNKNIVHHTVLNECHWERWGKSDVVISLRLFSDYVNAYRVMASRVSGNINIVKFHLSSSASIYALIAGRLKSGNLNQIKLDVLDAATELKRNGYLKFEWRMKILLACVLFASVSMSLIKIILTHISVLLKFSTKNKKHNYERIKLNRSMLSSSPTLAKIVLF